MGVRSEKPKFLRWDVIKIFDDTNDIVEAMK